jgi:outer membrane beta-barrel protein
MTVMTAFKIVKWAGALGLGCALAMRPGMAFAATIEFPESELASESVLPVFDHPESVKARNVKTDNRLELGGFMGYALTEAFYNPLSYGVNGTYHFNEISAVNLVGSFNVSGLNDYGNQLNPVPRSSPPENLNVQYAPAPKYLLLANYQHTAFYGKLSLSKDYIMNLSLYGFAGGGMMGIGDTSKPVANFGIGQKFYFTPSLAFRADLRFLLYQGPDPLSRRLSSVTSEQSASTFDEKLNFNGQLSFGAVYLLPAF